MSLARRCPCLGPPYAPARQLHLRKPYPRRDPSGAASRQGENARLLRATAAASLLVAGLTSLAVHNAPGRTERPGSAARAAELTADTSLAQLDLTAEGVYHDARNGFRIEFPAGWRVERAGAGGSVTARRGDATIAVMVLDASTPEMMHRVRDDFRRRGVPLSDGEARGVLAGQLDFRNFSEDEVASFVAGRFRKIREAAGGSRVLEQEVRLLGGRRAGYMRAVSPGEVTNVLYFTLHRGKYYHVAAGALAGKFDSLAPLLQRSIGSFRVEE